MQKPFVDDFTYDLGYFQSQAIVIFTLGLIFSGTNPLIGIFVGLFFTIKYWVEKYNLTFVYNREFEGGGVIKKQVLPFMLLGIYLFQILNIGYFTLFSEMYFKGGLIYLVLQSLALIFLNHNYSLKKRSSRIELAKIEEESMQAKEKGGRPLKTMVLGRDEVKLEKSE